MNENKNAPAFPVVDTENIGGQFALRLVDSGLSKREYFAGLAMQGIVSSTYSIDGWTYKEINAMANSAVLFADALIEQLSTPQP